MSTTTTETALERQVREEQEQHDRTLDQMQQAETDAGDDNPPEDESGQTAIIDRSAYEREDLQIPKIEGQSIDRIRINFKGSIMLDRSDPSDVAVYNELRLGRDVQLLAEAKCAGTGAKGAAKDLKVHSLSKPAGADWVQEAGA